MKRTRSILTIVVLLILTGFFIEKKILHRSTPVINLSELVLQDLSGKDIPLSQFANKPLVLNFWGTWCGPCLHEIPGFESAGKKFGDKVTIILISDEPADKIAAFKNKNNYQLLYAHSQIKFDSLHIAAVPVTCFYDAAGKLVVTKKQALDEEEITAAIAGLLK